MGLAFWQGNLVFQETWTCSFWGFLFPLFPSINPQLTEFSCSSAFWTKRYKNPPQAWLSVIKTLHNEWHLKMETGGVCSATCGSFWSRWWKRWAKGKWHTSRRHDLRVLLSGTSWWAKLVGREGRAGAKVWMTSCGTFQPQTISKPHWERFLPVKQGRLPAAPSLGQADHVR